METTTMLALTGAAYTYLKDIGGFALNERDRQKFAAIQMDLTEKIIQAQADVLEVQSTIATERALVRSLQDRLAELEREERERSRYQLAKLGTVGDFFAYRLRPASELTERADEPEHFVCQPCFDAGKKSVLHIGKYAALCSVCSKSTAILAQPPINYGSNSGGGWMGT